MNYIIKASALYLFWYVFVFLIVASDLSLHFLPQEIKSILARYPYQWDYELMFSSLFLIWGIFLWRFHTNKELVTFSGVAFLAQGVAVITLAFLRQNESIHFFLDSILKRPTGS